MIVCDDKQEAANPTAFDHVSREALFIEQEIEKFLTSNQDCKSDEEHAIIV